MKTWLCFKTTITLPCINLCFNSSGNLSICLQRGDLKYIKIVISLFWHLRIARCKCCFLQTSQLAIIFFINGHFFFAHKWLFSCLWKCLFLVVWRLFQVLTIPLSTATVSTCPISTMAHWRGYECWTSPKTHTKKSSAQLASCHLFYHFSLFSFSCIHTQVDIVTVCPANHAAS